MNKTGQGTAGVSWVTASIAFPAAVGMVKSVWLALGLLVPGWDAEPWVGLVVCGVLVGIITIKGYSDSQPGGWNWGRVVLAALLWMLNSLVLLGAVSAVPQLVSMAQDVIGALGG